MIKTHACIAVAATLLLAAGCGGDKDKEGGGANASKSASGKGPATEHRDLTFGSLRIEVDTPAGWTQAELGSSAFTFTKPGGIINSVMTVSETCQGSCDDIGKNLTELPDMQAGMQREMGYTVEVVEKTDDGRSFELALDQGGDKTHQIYVHRFEQGWEMAAGCILSLRGDEMKHLADYKKLCDSMTVAPK